MSGGEIPDNESQKSDRRYNPHPQIQHQDALMITMFNFQDHHKNEDDHAHKEYVNPTLAHFSPPQGRPIIDFSTTLPSKAAF